MNARPPVVLNTPKGYFILTDESDEMPIGPLMDRDQIRDALIELGGKIEGDDRP